MKIVNVSAREIISSAGLPALECELLLDDGARIISSVPSGTSRGSYEVIEKTDGNARLGGKGLQHAIATIENTIAPLILHQEPEINVIDAKLLELDGTKNKEIVGGNVMLAVSAAVLKAQAHLEQFEVFELVAHMLGAQEVTLPFPLFNMIEGGAHAQSPLRIQEFMIVPAGEHTARSCIEIGMMLFQVLEKELRKAKKKVHIGMEGGFVVNFDYDLDALEFLSEVVHSVNSSYGISCAIALDIAATQFYDHNTGLYTWSDDQFSTQDMITLYEQLITHYPIFSLEDPLSEHDWDGWSQLQARLGQAVQLVGDDLFATNPERIAYGIQKQAANAVIIKPNQIGTITQTVQAVQLCKEYGLSTIFSHRSIDTEDTLIVDLAVGTSASQLKAGGILRGERTAKYNQLLRIEDRLTTSLLGRN